MEAKRVAYDIPYTEQLDWIRLSRSENVGSRTFQALINIYGNANKALEAVPFLARSGGRKAPIKVMTLEQAEREVELCNKSDAKVILSCDQQYPLALKEVYDYPPVITVRGKLSVLDRERVAIVGSRNASANGCRFAYSIAENLSDKGLVIVSGLARGIDTSAHKGSLRRGTVAVMAGGIDRIYPSQNNELAAAICEQGALISERPYGTTPTARCFPRRNRIVSGLSRGVIVIEANMRSGSLITARMALEQNREVFAVPGSPMDPRSKGTNDLIKQGAHIVCSADDVIDVLGVSRHQGATIGEAPVSRFISTSVRPVSESELGKARTSVCTKLGADPTSVDEIIMQTGVEPKVVLTILLELELAGRLDRLPGGRVALICNNDAL